MNENKHKTVIASEAKHFRRRTSSSSRTLSEMSVKLIPKSARAKARSEVLAQKRAVQSLRLLRRTDRTAPQDQAPDRRSDKRRRLYGAPRNDEAISTWPIKGFFIVIVLLFWANTWGFAESQKIRVGHFPNVTHAPVLVARAMQHFEKSFGETVTIEWKTFNAGPEAIEALFAGEIDILYVGPNPAVNGFIRSKGEALRIIAGVASGGAAFVVRNEAGIERFEDIKGKRIASPQKGNTQDIALLHWMKQNGLAPTTQGGNVEVFNINGGDQIIAFAKKQVDAIWTVEPWVSRLVSEAEGKILFEESELWPDGKYATTVLVAQKEFMEGHPELVQKWVSAHVALIDWTNGNITEAKRIFNEQLKLLTGKSLPPVYLDPIFGRIEFTYDPMESQVRESAERAFAIGYLGREKIDLEDLYELSFLKQVENKS